MRMLSPARQIWVQVSGNLPVVKALAYAWPAPDNPPMSVFPPEPETPLPFPSFPDSETPARVRYFDPKVEAYYECLDRNKPLITYQLTAHTDWAGDVTIRNYDRTRCTGLDSAATFYDLIDPWIDWALACVSIQTQHLGAIPVTEEPDPVSRAIRTAQARERGQRILPLTFTRHDVTVTTPCESPICQGSVVNTPVSKLVAHAASLRHLAAEFDVPFAELQHYRRAFRVMAELGR